MNVQKEYARYAAIEKKINEAYHRIAVQMGVSDSVLWTLYCLCEDTVPHTQNSIAQKMGVPKQTINSAINRLLKDGYVYLKQIPAAKNNKQIVLTDNGAAFCAEQITPVVNAAGRAFNRLSETEREAHLSIGIKHNQFLIEELRAILKEKRNENI